MAHLPLVLSAHSKAWTADAGTGERKAVQQTGTCQFCRRPSGAWQQQGGNNSADLIVSCPLCYLPRHLDRSSIDDEAVLIWLPGMAQGVVNIMARQIHLACVREGLPPDYSAAARSAQATSSAYRAYRTLYERSVAAELRLGTRAPRQLGAALHDLAPADHERRATLLGGVRLLPLGRFFQAGLDIYPKLLRDWAMSQVEAS
jgi:intracellular multiplication protein IcmJ